MATFTNESRNSASFSNASRNVIVSTVFDDTVLSDLESSAFNSDYHGTTLDDVNFDDTISVGGWSNLQRS